MSRKRGKKKNTGQRREKPKFTSTGDLKTDILKVFNTGKSKPLNYKQVASALDISNSDKRKKIARILDEMVFKEELTEVGFGKYILERVEEYRIGVVDKISSGAAYIVSEGEDKDVFVSERNLDRALHGDTVKVSVFESRGKLEGEVVEVIKRQKESYIGRVEISPKFAFFIPDNQKLKTDFFIPLSKLKGAKEGHKVLAKITDWPSGSKSPFAEVVEVLGDAGDNDVVMHSILLEYDLPHKFPEEVEAEAEKIPMELDKGEIAKRRDFRDITTFTIDPHDAKDFDDALSIKYLDNGNYEIGVHIADVSHYVQEGSILDVEALERATSVYLVDRVVPMLPEKLSNGVCSLRPQEEKFCFSAVFEVNKEAQVVGEWFGRTVIFSDKRFTYEEAQAIIEGGNGPMKNEILLMDGLAKKMRRKRLKKGGLTFDRVEVKFHLAEDGSPTGVYFKEGKDANKLIEEFMLLANRKVAAFIGAKSQNKGKAVKTFVYRIHDKPSPEKFDQLANFVTQFGHFMKAKSEKEMTGSISKLLEDVKGKREGNMIETLAIRTMAKAEYSTNNIGHYGLGFTHYSHFTSPIRRYPDVIAHRLLQHYLDGGKSKNAEEIEELCIHSSKQEKLASEAERDSIKYKQVEFLKDKIGAQFEAVISGVTDWGIYAEIKENMCEGMIPIRSLTDDTYVFDQDNFCLVGKRYGEQFQLGDELIISVKRADLVKRQLDFEFVDRN